MKRKLLVLVIVLLMALGCASFGSTLRDAGDKVSGVATTVSDTVGNVVGEVTEGDVVGVFVNAIDGIGNLLSAVGGLISVPATVVQDAVVEGVDAVVEAVDEAVDAVVEAVTDSDPAE